MTGNLVLDIYKSIQRVSLPAGDKSVKITDKELSNRYVERCKMALLTYAQF